MYALFLHILRIRGTHFLSEKIAHCTMIVYGIKSFQFFLFRLLVTVKTVGGDIAILLTMTATFSQ